MTQTSSTTGSTSEPDTLSELSDRVVSLQGGDAAPLAASTADLINTVFADKYLVLEKLGEGGVGTVYKVKHIHLDKLFALKVLQASQARGDAILRFQQEAKVVSSLSHPNIVTIGDFGITSSGLPYMVMDLLEGVPLSTLRKETKLSVERMSRIFRQVCDALSYAHERSIVHRDIKPANIVVRTDEAGMDHVTVVDFGIAKIIPQEDAGEMHLTRTGDVFGTPLYMSPEQCLGQTVDSRSDIYSLGCVMYEAFAGTAPFKGETLFEVVTKQIHNTPAPISRPTRTYADRKMEAVILKAMAKVPADRYRFAMEMGTDLRLAEVGDGGFGSSLKLLYTVSRGRARAGSKTDAWWKALAQIASTFAVCLSVILFSFPNLCSYEAQELERNWLITERLQDALSNPNERTEDMFQTLKTFSDNVDAIEDLVKDDPKQRRIYKFLHRDTTRVYKATKRLVNLIDYNVEQQEMQNVGGAFRSLGAVIHKWLGCANLYSELRAEAFNQCNEHIAKLRILLPVWAVTRVLAVLNLVVLAFLLATRVKAAIARRRSPSTRS